MSTRAQVILKDAFKGELWFYRHSDGYPEGTMPTLSKFLEWVEEGRIRDNVEQAGGWLIVLGHMEYASCSWAMSNGEPGNAKSGMGWKVGAYEPCACQKPHGDIEFLYTVDLAAKTIACQKRIGCWGLYEQPTFEAVDMDAAQV